MTNNQNSLANDAVQWEGTLHGWFPKLSPAAEALVREGSSGVPELLAALSDPQRFVVAHVLLTQIAGMKYETHPTWNGLRLDMTPGGDVVIDAAQRGGLEQRWRNHFGASPSPSRPR